MPPLFFEKEEMGTLERFEAIFRGLDSAYGTYRIERQNDKNKLVGKGFVAQNPPIMALWQKHLDGVEPSLGIIPIRADNTCTWGAIDIDQYPLDHVQLIDKITKLSLPLVVLRSKSGGAHVYAFVREPVPAADMQKYLTACAALLGEAGREIFPKQSEILIERGDTGNYLNLPYFGGDRTTRYAVKQDGTAATLEEFFAMYEAAVQDALQMPQAPQRPETPVSDGPPCLQSLCTQGFPEGTRNNGLFSLGIYLKKAFPSNWHDKLLEYNMKYFSPPLGLTEIQTVIKQLDKKDYRYKCKDEPIKGFCNSGLCRQRKHGIGGDGPDSPQLSSLTKFNSEPPLWFLDVGGRRIELETESLFNQLAFQRACVEKINILPPTVRKADWEAIINGLLAEMVTMNAIAEASVDTTITGRFADLLEEFCTHMQQAMHRDEILLGRVWTDEELGVCYFRMKDLEAHFRRHNFVALTSPKVAQRLRELEAEPTNLLLKGRTTRVWRLPAFNRQAAPFDAPRDDGVPF